MIETSNDGLEVSQDACADLFHTSQTAVDQRVARLDTFVAGESELKCLFDKRKAGQTIQTLNGNLLVRLGVLVAGGRVGVGHVDWLFWIKEEGEIV